MRSASCRHHIYRHPVLHFTQDGSGEVDVSELEELLEAAGEKVNPLELESVFQVTRSPASRAAAALSILLPLKFHRNSMRMAAVSSRSMSFSTQCTSAGCARTRPKSISPKVPCASTVHSGSKSPHTVSSVRLPRHRPRWRRLCRRNRRPDAVGHARRHPRRRDSQYMQSVPQQKPIGPYDRGLQVPRAHPRPRYL
jgi:hypothetical protein